MQLPHRNEVQVAVPNARFWRPTLRLPI